MGSPREAIEYFATQLRERRFSNEAATHYGMAIAYLRSRDFGRSQLQLERAAQLASHPMLDLLSSKLKAAQGDWGGAQALLKTAAVQQPAFRPLQYALVQAQQRVGAHGEALDYLATLIQLYPRDWRLYSLQALSYASIGKTLLQHQ